jgi:hypothetical protein
MGSDAKTYGDGEDLEEHGVASKLRLYPQMNRSERYHRVPSKRRIGVDLRELMKL